MRASNNASASRFLFALFAALMAWMVTPRFAFAQVVPWTQRLVNGTNEGFTRMAHDSARRVSVCFGGTIGSSGYSSTTWEWDGISWMAVGTEGLRPSPRSQFALAYDSWRGVTVLYGGAVLQGGTAYSAETWEWDGLTWTLRAVGGPPPLVAHAMAFDSARGVTVMHGGRINGAIVEEGTWEWDGTTWTLAAPNGGPFCETAGMAFDSARGVTVLYGGSRTDGRVWEWDGVDWTTHNALGPQPQLATSLAFDSLRGVTVLYGGLDNGVSLSNQTWEWNGLEWSQRVGAGPPNGGGYAMAFDSFRGRTVLFGGSSGWQTWELGTGTFCIAVASQPSSTVACRQSTTTFTVTPSGAGPFNYRWRKNRTAISASENPTAFTQTLTLHSPSLADAGLYDCIITNGCGSVYSNFVSLVVCPADVNCDSGVDVSDLLTFLGAFEEGSVAGADLDNGSSTGISDGGVDINDLLFFLARFEAGC